MNKTEIRAQITRLEREADYLDSQCMTNDGNTIRECINEIKNQIFKKITTMKQEKRYQIVTYHHSENGFDEKGYFYTLNEAKFQAREYLEDPDWYEGAGIWDFQTSKFVWVKGYFPIRQALTPEAYEPHANYYEQIFS